MSVIIDSDNNNVNITEEPINVTVSLGGPDVAAVWGGITGDLADQEDLQAVLDDKVPYTGATGDVNIGEYGIQLGNLEFDNTPTNVPTAAGSVYWSDTDGTLNMVLKGGNTISRIGETQHIRALNNTGTQIARGKVVYVVGAQGQRLTIALADADTEILSKDTIGITSEDIADGAEGFVIVQGVINNISTTGMSDGATVYLSQTAGGYTTTPPVDPAHLVVLGFIVNGNSGGAGSIYVKVDNGYELGELHDVNTTGATNGQVLTYNGTTWVPATNGSGTITSIATSAPITGGTITSSGTIGITQAGAAADGYLSATDWNTFNNKQAALTNPVTGTGTAGQVAYWSGTGTQTGSQDFTWNDTTKILSFSNSGTLINEIRISSVNSNTMMGRLAGSSASLTGGSNSFFGQNSGSANTTGNGNSAFGLRSGNNNTTGSGNVFFGSQAGRYLADGTTSLTVTNNSVFLGFDTRAAADSQTNQIAIGYQAIGLGSNTTVIGNSSTTQTWLGGNLTLGTTTSGGRLTVRGSGTTSATTALLVQNSGATDLLQILDNGRINQTIPGSSNNTIFGSSAGASASLTGGSNSFFGQNAGFANTTGSNNSFFGATAGQNNTTGVQNSFFGFRASLGNTTGSANVTFGFAAAQFNTTGNNNVFIARDAGRLISDGSNLTVANNSVYIGYDTRAAADSQTNQIAIGYQAIGLGSNTTVIGNSSTTQTWLGGNLTLGTTTSGGRLTVRGSGTTSSTTALLVQNSDGNATFRVLDNGLVYLGTQSNRGFWVNDDGSNTPNLGGATLRFSHGLSSQAQNGFVFLGANSTLNATAGIQTNVLLSQSFGPTSGTAVFNQLLINNTINQTGGANGITRGLYVNPTLTSAADWRSVEFSNNTGWGLYGAGTANNYLGGRLGLNSTALTNVTLRNSLAISGSASSFGYFSDGIIQSGVTSTASYFHISPQTQNASFTLTNLNGYYVENPTIGASSTVTNVYGFYGNIASGTGRWNLYMNGTAANYLAGNLGIGTASPTIALQIERSSNGSESIWVRNTNTGASAFGAVVAASYGVSPSTTGTVELRSHNFNHSVWPSTGMLISNSSLTNGLSIFATAGNITFNTTSGGNERARIESGGNFVIGTTSASARLHIRGSGTTSATTALLVQNSTPSALLTLTDDGVFKFGSSNAPTQIFPFSAAFNTPLVDQRNLQLFSSVTTQAATLGAFYFTGLDFTQTANNQIFVNIGKGFAPTSGTATFANIVSSPTINQTGGANGITRGLYVNPTLTSAADWRGIESVAASNANHTLLKLRNETVDVFTVKADSKIGFFNATPVAQPTTGISEAAFVENSGGTAVNVDSTFAGYTIQQIAQALKDLGILA